MKHIITIRKTILQVQTGGNYITNLIFTGRKIIQKKFFTSVLTMTLITHILNQTKSDIIRKQ